MSTERPRTDQASQPGSYVEYFEIVDLHETQNIRLEFSGPFGVFIADNGSGKTTALYLLQCLLRSDFGRMRRFTFEEIRFRFRGDETKSLLRSSLRRAPRQGWWRGPGRIRIDAARLANLAQLPPELAMQDSYARAVSREMDIPLGVLLDRVGRGIVEGDLLVDPDNRSETKKANEELKALSQYISQTFKHSVIYLPTYRRVEQDLKSIFDPDAKIPESDQQHIHFGMGDVTKRIASVSEKIRDHFVSEYSKISGQMLSEFTRKTDITRQMKHALSDREQIQIVLGRVGKSISDEVRNVILDMADTGKLTDNAYLAMFIFKLIEAYEVVRDLDTSVQTFADVCNGYLINKQCVYDSANVSLKMTNSNDGKELSLDSLSSGEKQVLGVMSEIYLGEEKTYGIVIDEPELSLSVEWQKKFLPDIVHSTKCVFLAAATHSPFIFENELDAYARAVRVHRKAS